MAESKRLSFHEIQSRLEEIEINLKSHLGDERYDLSDLIAEREEMEELLDGGHYVDVEEI